MKVARADLKLVSIENEPNDSELIEGSLAGDVRSFELMVQRYQKNIFRVALAICRNDHEADVITQDTFIQAYTNLERFEGRAGLETWLTRIAINRSRDVLRSRRVSSGRELDGGSEAPILQLVDPSPGAEERVMAVELRAAIERAVATLPPQQKIIFQMRHLEDLSLEEIATLLELKAGTVRAHLFRALQKVRGLLAASWRPEYRRDGESNDESL